MNYLRLVSGNTGSDLQSLLVLAPPAVVGGVNGSNVICYCFIVTRAISLVLYKRVSLKIGAYENGCKVCC